MSKIEDILIKEHLENLRKSGLIDDTILSANIESISPKKLKEKLGYKPKNMKSAYCIPYPEIGFCRYRIFYHRGSENTAPKYLQQKGSENHLYIPEFAREHSQNPNIPLYITEGEKKALKACQEGLCCISLSGLWSWSDGKKRLIKDFQKIALKDRKVFIVPDNDWQEPGRHGYSKNLKKAVYELSYRLIEKGANVFLVNLNRKEE